MKKITNILPILGLTLLVAACDYNELNFPGYADEAVPTNVFAYEDTLTDADYTLISTLGLSIAVDAADSAAVRSIATLKYFPVEAPASRFIPLWIANTYLYGDDESYVMVTSVQYIADEGETQTITEKYVLDSIWKLYDAEIFYEPFTTTLGEFTVIDLNGTQTWAWGSYDGGCAKMSGYVSSESKNYDNDDWLVSPAMDLTKRSRASLTFDQVVRYGDAQDTLNMISLWITDSYNGESAIDTTEWTELAFTNGYKTSGWTFATTDPVSLDAFAGKANVRIAFRYHSFKEVSTPTWELNNIQILEP